MEIGEKLTSHEPTLEDFIVKDVVALCSPQEKDILKLKLKGYKYGEISMLLNCSISKINNYMQSIREKARELIYER